MKKDVFMLAAFIIATTHETYGKSNLELPWSGYWPNVGEGTSSAPQAAPQSIQETPVATPATSASPPQTAHHNPFKQFAAPMEESSAPVIVRPTISIQSPKEIHMTPQRIGAAPSTATPTPAAQPAAAPVAQAAGGNTAALAGIGAAFAAMGTMGASSQRSQPSHLNPYMMQGRTATERFNCVGKPPQQCQQEWNQLVQRIESMPGVRIINKSYSCGPGTMGIPGMMPTGYPAQPYGMHPQQAYGMQHPMPMQQPHRSTLGSAAHGLTSLLRR